MVSELESESTSYKKQILAQCNEALNHLGGILREFEFYQSLLGGDYLSPGSERTKINNQARKDLFVSKVIRLTNSLLTDFSFGKVQSWLV